MSEAPDPAGVHFVETLEYRRFAEFCDACRRYRYIGLCCGPPGVGKTLSARRYAHWDTLGRDVLDDSGRRAAPLELLADPTTAFYTTPVVNTPRLVNQGVERARQWLHTLAREPLRREEEAALERARQRDGRHQDEYLQSQEWLFKPLEPLRPNLSEVAEEYGARSRATPDPTNLVLVDEADRLKMASLEQMRSVFDAGGIGLVLIGMPGLEKRLARYPQFYSRVGFVHGFRPLNAAEVRRLMGESWTPPGVRLPPLDAGMTLDEEVIAAVVRITGGNFRLLGRLLAQTERIVEINRLPQVTRQAVEAARESLVIGPAG